MTRSESTRREFLGLVGGAAALALTGPRAFAAGRPIRAALVLPAGDPGADAVRAGAEMGADEARRAASLLGAGFELETVEAGGPDEAAKQAERLVADGVSSVVGGFSAECCAAIAGAAPERFLEVRSRRELSPDAAPPRHLAVTPGYAEHARALVAGLGRRGLSRFAASGGGPTAALARSAGWAEVSPAEAEVVFADGHEGASAPGSSLRAGVGLPLAPGTAVPVAWHPSLRRYGAAQLNERFRERTGRGMDENAWYGWMAVKLVAEAGLRGRPLAEARTDGHKGGALSFREGRLHQPLYVLLEDGDGVEVLDA